MAIACLAKIRDDGKVNCNYETDSNAGVERSATHAQFSRATMAISCSAKIRADSKVNFILETNSKRGPRGVLHMFSSHV